MSRKNQTKKRFAVENNVVCKKINGLNEAFKRKRGKSNVTNTLHVEKKKNDINRVYDEKQKICEKEIKMRT